MGAEPVAVQRLVIDLSKKQLLIIKGEFDQTEVDKMLTLIDAFLTSVSPVLVLLTRPSMSVELIKVGGDVHEDSDGVPAGSAVRP